MNKSLKMNKSIIPLIGMIIAIVIILGLLLHYGAQINPQNQSLNNNQNQEQQVENSIDIVIGTDDDKLEFIIDYQEEYTVFQYLEKVRDLNQLNLNFEEYDFGIFITEIGNLKPEASTEYISFIVNEQESAVGVSDYIPSPFDKIRFQIELISNF